VLIVDTGPLVATADAADRNHDSCRTLLETDPGPLVTSPLVIAEAGWLIRRQLNLAAEVALYQSIAAGEITVEALTTRDWIRIAELVDTYADLGLDAADASVIALAELYDQTRIATLDHRDFRVVRPAHCEAFELLPR
jgi:predicted nucleic acid-binding protein